MKSKGKDGLVPPSRNIKYAKLNVKLRYVRYLYLFYVFAVTKLMHFLRSASLIRGASCEPL